MASILLTTLGRAYKADGDSYRKTCYRFPDGREIESLFFGDAFYQWLVVSGKSIGKVVILGTEGSSWDILVDGSDEELYYRLGDTARTTDEKLLRDLETHVSESWNCRASCRIIPDGFRSEDQYRILSIITQEIPQDTGLWMDITHGFRSLPVLELFSSMNLEETKNVHLEGIFYGMFDKNENNLTPVAEISFVNELKEWNQAIYSLNHQGKLNVLLSLPGMETYQEQLRDLIFYEQMNQISKAGTVASNILKRLKTEGINSKAGEMYCGRLMDFFKWSEGGSYSLRQYEIACRLIEQHEYVQGIIMLYESLVTHAVPDGSDPTDFNIRLNITETGSYCRIKECFFIRDLRNVIVHGTKPKHRNAGEIMRILNDPHVFEKKIKELTDAVHDYLYHE